MEWPLGTRTDSLVPTPALTTANAAPATSADLPPAPPALDRDTPQLTWRAVLTGMLLGGLLSICNVYSGLKLGIAFNMSITAALLGYAFWSGLHMASGGRVRPWSLLESNINQTASSAGASVASAGLVASIPALALLSADARTLTWPQLAVWCFSVMLVGIVVAIGLRRQMVIVSKLPFAMGIASAEMLKELHATGARVAGRVFAFLAAAVAGCAAAVYQHGVDFWNWTALRALPGSAGKLTLAQLGFRLDGSLLLYAVGALIGLRACLSLLLGAVLAYIVLGPAQVQADNVAELTSRQVLNAIHPWVLWPGVTLIIVSSLVSFAFTWRSLWAALRGLGGGQSGSADTADPGAVEAVPRGWFIGGLVLVLVLSVTLQLVLFKVPPLLAALGVLLSFVLALVGGRLAGEVGYTPVGTMGKLAQLALGAAAPHSPATNLMAANVAGGAASQCADLLHDLKCGYLIGASPRKQVVAQTCGALAGALVGPAVYLLLIRDPVEQLFKAPWPAPGVAAAKAVADLFERGAAVLPANVGIAIVGAALLGILLPIVEQYVPARRRLLVPSAASIGLAMILPASFSLTICAGGLLAAGLSRLFKSWTTRYLITLAAGAIAGDAFTGVAFGLYETIDALVRGG